VNYVVMGAETIQVSFAKGRTQRAEIVAQDFELGLALLKVKRTGLASVPVASSERLERGQSVFALGSTGPRERRVAGGLLTYLGEFVAYWEYLLERSLVCSASNPGFGGGPLFTVAGRMVGVVSLNLSEIGRCSLAIPGECFEQNRAEYLRYGRAISRPQRAWLVVAASKGMGKASAMGLAQEGARVAMCARGEADLKAAAEEVRQKTGAEVLAVPADASKLEDITRVVGEVKGKWGGVDVLVANVGGPPPGPFDQMTDEQWKAAFEQVHLSTVRFIRAVLPDMKRKKWGRILAIQSRSAKQPVEGLALPN